MRILMIEDQRHFAGLMVRMLEGLDIDVVETLAAAKSALATTRYDLMLIDLNLPDSEGLDTLRALQGYRTPKIVLTGRFDLSSEATALGCIDFVTKTTDMDEIFERIMFNVNRVKPRKRFDEKVFQEIRACFEMTRVRVGELTTG